MGETTRQTSGGLDQCPDTYNPNQTDTNHDGCEDEQGGGTGGDIQLAELHIYGRSRLGMMKPEGVTMSPEENRVSHNVDVALEEHNSVYVRRVNRKQYELTDHLGNVRVVITDVKTTSEPLANDKPQGPYKATLLASNNYYPFGMLQPERHWSTEEYRYGYNGKEMDNEASGNGNQYDYGFRIYNPRIAKFLSVDPLAPDYPWYTPYQFAGNMPIWAIDLDGLEPAPGSQNYGRHIFLGAERHYIGLQDRTLQLLNNNKEAKNENWTTIKVSDIHDAAAKIRRFKEDDISMKIETVVIGLHGGGGRMIMAKPDDPNFEMGASDWGRDGVVIGGDEINQYMSGETGSLSTEEVEAVKALESIMANIETGGNLILSACEVGAWDETVKAVSKLGQGRISIIANGDKSATAVGVKVQGRDQHLNPINERIFRVLDMQFTPSSWFGDGWVNLPSTSSIPIGPLLEPGKKRNLQLNSTGQVPFNFVPNSDNTKD